MAGRLFIGGAWQDAASSATYAIIDPASEEPIGEVARGAAADVDRAVQAADQAMRGPWRELAPAARGRLLERLATLIAGAREELAQLETGDMGKPIGQPAATSTAPSRRLPTTPALPTRSRVRRSRSGAR
jgi:acyl-CoA reductase-like NAD-dependent aldehyde dehydrogenase